MPLIPSGHLPFFPSSASENRHRPTRLGHWAKTCQQPRHRSQQGKQTGLSMPPRQKAVWDRSIGDWSIAQRSWSRSCNVSMTSTWCPLRCVLMNPDRRTLDIWSCCRWISKKILMLRYNSINFSKFLASNFPQLLLKLYPWTTLNLLGKMNRHVRLLLVSQGAII